MRKNCINEINNKYGALTVLELTKDKNNRTAWRCRCNCGNEKIVRGTDLRAGKITTCGQSGCIEKIKRNGNFKDLTGQRFGRLIVLEIDNQTSNKKLSWKCQCDCGNIVSVIGENLTLGATHSCGCLRKELAHENGKKDISNQRFGKLIALYPTIQNQYGTYLWKCQCDCGTLKEISINDLTSGNTSSCGCLASSSYELKISQFLTQENIIYKQEYSFNDLKSKNNRKLRFDFAIFDQLNNLTGLIEFHGAQHYQSVEYFGGEKAFLERQERDKQKENYCHKNNIPLLILNQTDKKDFQIKILNFIRKGEHFNGKI